MRKTKNELARRIYDLSERIKADKDEMDELRAGLAEKMKPGQVIGFDTPEGPCRLKLCECQETILEENEKIFDTIGKRRFMVAANVGCGGLKKSFEDLPAEGAELALKACTKAIVTKTTLKLLKGRG
jgi:hypothetical protein